MKKNLLLTAAWIIVTVLFVGVFFIYPESIYTNITIVFGWVLFAGQLTWNHSEVVYLKLKKILFIIKNPDCVWDMSVEFKGIFDNDMFEKVDKALYEYTEDFDVTYLSDKRRNYRVKTINFQLYYDDYYDVFRFKLNKLELSYRRSHTLMEEEINYLLEVLSRTLKVDSSEYYFKVSFKEFNPFYGFYLRRLSAREIKNFNVTFKVDKDRVSINKDSIDIQTTSLQKLNNLSKEYLTLSPR